VGIALLFHDLGARRGGGQQHAPAALPPGKTRYPFYRRLGGPQDRSNDLCKNFSNFFNNPEINYYIRRIVLS
jgi:hypothetical protein